MSNLHSKRLRKHSATTVKKLENILKFRTFYCSRLMPGLCRSEANHINSHNGLIATSKLKERAKPAWLSAWQGFQWQVLLNIGNVWFQISPDRSIRSAALQRTAPFLQRPPSRCRRLQKSARTFPGSPIPLMNLFSPLALAGMDARRGLDVAPHLV